MKPVRKIITMNYQRKTDRAQGQERRIYAEMWADRDDVIPKITCRVGSVRVNSEMTSALLKGEAKPSYFLGTVEAPGWLGKQLLAIVPHEVLHPAVKVRFRMSDEGGNDFIEPTPQTSGSAARSAAEQYFTKDPE